MILLLLLCTAAVSCTKDPQTPQGGDPTGGEAVVRLHIKTPSRARPGSDGTRAVADMEYNIANICMLVLGKSGDDFLFRQMVEVEGQNITQVEATYTQATFQAKLLASAEPIKLILLANCDATALAALLPAPETPEAQLSTLLTQDFLTAEVAAMPMYGEVELASLSAEDNNTIYVSMQRSIARVNVVQALTDGSRPFRLASMDIYRANNKVQLIPDAASLEWNTTSAPYKAKSTAPSVPAGSGNQRLWGYTLLTGGLAFENAYIPESDPADTSEADYWSNATSIVVGGYYDDDTALSYYRIDFNSGIAGHPFGQVLRNYRYTFNIIKVLSRGWPTADEAANNNATSLVVEARAWDENTSDMYLGPADGYIGISNRDVVLKYRHESQDSLFLETNLPFTLKAGDADAVEGDDGATLDTDLYTIEVSQYDPADETKYRLMFTAKETNETGSHIEGDDVTVKAGEVTFTIKVSQESFSEEYEDVTVKVLSVGVSWGSMGGFQSFGAPVGFSQKIKDILTNPAYFGPEGVVKIRGFELEYIPASAVDADNDVPNLELLLEHIDIVRLSYGATIQNDACAMAIAEWTLESPRHLLFLTTDAAGSNPRVRAALNNRLQYRLGWYEGGQAGTVIGGSLTAEQRAIIGGTPNNYLWGCAYPTPVPGDELIMGPDAAFGAVDRTKAFRMSDGTFGFIPGSYPYHTVNGTSPVTNFDTTIDLPVIPLITSAPTIDPPGPPYTAATNPPAVHTTSMIIGLNAEVGIAYIGEAQIGSTFMLDPNGNIQEFGENVVLPPELVGRISPYQNELNRIYSNLWAWGVMRVLGED